MIPFKDGNTVQKYKVNIYDNLQAKRLIHEMLNNCTMDISKKMDFIHCNYGAYKVYDGYATKDTIVSTFRRVNSYTESRLQAYCPAEIITTEFTFSTPYTLALAAENFRFSKDGIDQSEVLRRLQTCSNLASVVGSSKIEGLDKLLSKFNGDYDALELFLKNNHPDLFYLRRYLECISLSRCEEYEVREDEDDERKKEIEIAASNLEVSKKFNLKFKGVDFS